MNHEWRRVTKASPCIACGHSDWCTVAPDLGYCCMRVQSNKPLRNGGWLHPFDTAPRALPPKEPPRPTINANEMMRSWTVNTNPSDLMAFAFQLGVSQLSLIELGCAWAESRHAWAFPMKDGYGNTVGIRLRSATGSKWAVPGSHQGLFMPTILPQRTAFICEGPTDTAAAVSIGLYCIGRPSCSGGVQQVLTAFNRLGIERAVIVADNDGPGMAGATALADQLNIPSCILIPPAKDMRDFVCMGGTADVINSMVNTLIWKQP